MIDNVYNYTKPIYHKEIGGSMKHGETSLEIILDENTNRMIFQVAVGRTI